jgi:hypothetical protein
MALLDVFTAVGGALGSIPSLFGEENLAEHGAPPRVVWVPTADKFGPPTQRGSVVGDARALHTNRAAVAVHCWGADTASALALRDQFIVALRGQIGPNYELQDGGWAGQAMMTNGRVYILSLTLNIPIVDTAPAVAAPPISLPQDVAMQH